MLILKRRLHETIVIGDTIRVRVERIGRTSVSLAIHAPKDIPVDREEISDKKKTNENSHSPSFPHHD